MSLLFTTSKSGSPFSGKPLILITNQTAFNWFLVLNVHITSYSSSISSSAIDALTIIFGVAMPSPPLNHTLS